jgi:hypothetical protein
MRKLSYIGALVALLVPSPALAANEVSLRDVSVHDVGADPTSQGGGGSDPGDDEVGDDEDALDVDDDRSATMGESEGGGCSQSGIPPAGRNASLALLGLAFMSFGIRLEPRRRRARISARR